MRMIFFLEQMHGLGIDELKALRDKIFNLELIFIAVSSEVDAFTVFETLNAKWKDLRNIDLIKNQIYRLYPSISGSQEPESSWKIIKANIEWNEDTFLNNFWAALHQKVSDKNLYKKFIEYSKKELNKKEGIIKFMNDLLKYSRIYSWILEPSRKPDSFLEERFILESLNTFDIKVTRPFLLILIDQFQEKNISKNFYLQALRWMERFHFVYHAILHNHSRGLDQSYASFARELGQCTNKQNGHIVIRAFIKSLKEKLISDTSRDVLFNNFEEKFDEAVYYSESNKKEKKKAKALTYYFLTRIELIESNSFNRDDWSIEHLLSQSSKAKESTINNIWNLFLLEAFINRSIGNKDFKSKKEEIICNTAIKTTKKFLEEFKSNTWWQEDILERRIQLLKKYYDDCKIPVSNNQVYQQVWNSVWVNAIEEIAVEY